MLSAWTFALVRLAGAIAVAVLLGLVTGRMALWLTIVLGGVLAWQFVNLFRLQRWLRHRAHEDPPDIGGVWGDAIAVINRIYRRKQFHKRRVMQQFREFRRLSAALPDGAILLSQGREIRWFNRTAAELLGLRRKVDIGIPIANLVRDPEFAAYLAKPGGNGVVVHVQGRDAWLALFVIPAGEQFLMLVRDVTREVRLEQMRKDFVANASHELRSPLTVISGYLDELANEEAIGAEWREPIVDMRRQALRMREIVEDLLELSRLEATADEAPMSPVDMPALLERLVREAEMSGQDVAEIRPAGRAGVPAAGQRDRALFRCLEPDLQRGQVHAGRWYGHDPVGSRARRCAARRARHRHRHRTRAPATPHGAFLPRGPRARARQGRLRTRSLHRQARTAAARRTARD